MRKKNMTVYQGGKKRLGQKIFHRLSELEDTYVLKKFTKLTKLPYLEPFVGMCGVARYFAAEKDRTVTLGDSNKDLVCMWQSVQDGSWTPPLTCTRDYYDFLKDSVSFALESVDKKTQADRMFLGCAASYGGNYFSGGFRLKSEALSAALAKRDYLGEGARSIKALRPSLLQGNTSFKAQDYREWSPQNSLVYCDPPYLNNKLGPKCFREFDHTQFWDVIRQWSKNNLVLVSERTAPPDFISVWTAKSTLTVSRKGHSNTEHLFIKAS